MDIFAVAQQRQALWEAGYRPVPVRTGLKIPHGFGWQIRARMNPPESVLEQPLAAALNTGILADGLRALDIDVDDPEVSATIKHLAFEMLGHAPVRSRENSSRILLLYGAETGEPSKRVLSGLKGKIEILGKGQQFVALGIHPSGVQFTWQPELETTHRDNLCQVSEEAIGAFLDACAEIIGANPVALQQDCSPLPTTSQLPTKGEAGEREKSYAMAALDDEIKNLASTPPGNRNNALNNAAFKLGTMVGSGWLSPHEVEAGLMDASAKCGLLKDDGVCQVQKTIRSGLSAGMRSPRPGLISDHYSALGAKAVEQLIETRNKDKKAILAFPVGHYLDDNSPVPDDIIAPRLLTPGGLLVLGGSPKVGKSDLLLHLLTHMAEGLPFLGFTPARPLKIFYVQAEIHYHYLKERLKNIGLSQNDLIKLSRRNLVITPHIRILLDENGVDSVAASISDHFDPAEVDIIAIDPLRNVFDAGKSGNENDNSAMLAFLQDRIECLRHKINPNAGIILAHHTKKISPKLLEEDPFNGLSGAGSLRSFYTTGIIMFRPDENATVKKLIFELRNGASINAKVIDKIDGKWQESSYHSDRLVNKDYGAKLDAERRRRHDVILEIIFEEGKKGKFYTSSLFGQVFENQSGLGGRYSIRDRIDVLTSKGYIKFNKEGAARSRNGYLCVERMEVPTGEEITDSETGEVIPQMKRFLPTHFRSPSNGALLPVENPEVWVYNDSEIKEK
jgi:hypothetical protein